MNTSHILVVHIYTYPYIYISKVAAGHDHTQAMMWGSLAFFLAIAYFDVGQAIALHKRDSANVVALDISRNHVPDPVARDLRRRSTMTVLELLDNEVSMKNASLFGVLFFVFYCSDEYIRKRYISAMSR